MTDSDEERSQRWPCQLDVGPITSMRLHWPEYAMELAQMALYLFFTCVFATLFQHPDSPIRHLVPNATVRRACFSISVGATIVAIVLTPWGKQSGGHLKSSHDLHVLLPR